MDRIDPKGLIADSYRIPGISLAECRSIFLDWALSTNVGNDAKTEIAALLDRYLPDFPDHPMTRVLQEGLGAIESTGRRGGRQMRRHRPPFENP